MLVTAESLGLVAACMLLAGCIGGMLFFLISRQHDTNYLGLNDVRPVSELPSAIWVITCSERGTEAIIQVVTRAGYSFVADCSCWSNRRHCRQKCVGEVENHTAAEHSQSESSGRRNI